ncbi:MAG TPA: CHASE3 domain-containing protein [Nostocaceae cyanobacterium]|nr:CHASE3 domain-containing protein [Nostocaceae cyanobacterium]
MLLQIARTIFQRRLVSAIALPSVLLLLFSGVSLWQVSNLLSALQWVDHTNQVISQANYTQKLLLDLETGARGYILTGDEEFLEPYQKSQPVINQAFQELGRLVADNPAQVQRVNQLYSRYQEWHRLTSLALERYRQGEVQPLPVFKLRKRNMDQIRSQIATFISTEEELRDQRSQVARLATQQVVVTTILLTVVIGGILANFIKLQLMKMSQSYENALRQAAEETGNSQRVAQRLSHLHEIDKAILSAESDVSIIQNALKSLSELVNCQKAVLILFDFETNTVQLLTDDAAQNMTLPINNCVTATVTQQKQTCLMNDIAECRQLTLILEQFLQEKLRSRLIIPMQVQGELIGEVCLAATQAKSFEVEAQEIAQEVAEQLAIAIQQSRMRQQLQKYAEKLEERVEERTTQLREVNRELEGFSYSVSHDLRAPLRTMQGFSQALLEDYQEQLDQIGQDYLHYIAEGAMQMDTLITELLAYSRLSQAQIPIQPVDLEFVVTEALNQFSKQIQEQEATVLIDRPLPMVMAHRSTLVQVMINLISNAIKFVKPNVSPFLKVYTEEYTQEGKSWIKLWVIDHGIGIAPEHQERIFRVFERLHGVEVYAGTGIGLATVRKGMERMGGFCGVESQLGAGSGFWIALPKAFSI